MNSDWKSLLQNQVPPQQQQKNRNNQAKSRGPPPKRSAWNVHKFGGSTFENSKSYSFVSSLVNNFSGKNLIVVSALYGITNLLYAVCRRAKSADWQNSEEWILLIFRISSTIKERLGDTHSGIKESQRFAADILYLREVLFRMAEATPEDQESIEQLVVGYGEIWSARLLTHTLRDDYHRSAAFLDARDVLVIHQETAAAAAAPTTPGLKIEVCWDLSKEKLKKWFYQCRWCDVLVVTGFVARNQEGFPITLKRNGSDFSATIFSVLTKANSVTIWKDVNGMYTSDPKKNPDAQFIPYQTFEEAEEASRRGAFVIQADCIEPAKLHNVPIFLRNCFNLDCPGTRIGPPCPPISRDIPSPRKMEEVPVEMVDHLMESIQPVSSVSEELYSLCSDRDTIRHRSSSCGTDTHSLEIIV